MAITDDAVRERHGVACRKDSHTAWAINVYESEEYVCFPASECVRQLTPWQARYLASKIYRLARRVQQRGEAA